MGIRRTLKRQSAAPARKSDTPASIETPRSSSGRDLPEELVAARAYEKWQLRGSPIGQDGEQDWFAARAELEAESLNWAAPQAGDDQRSTGK
jgi:hypothetical protein